MTHIINYEPLKILDDINKLFGKTFYNLNEEDHTKTGNRHWTPMVDIKEEQDSFKLLMDIPGISKEDIKIAMENNMLTVQGERKLEVKEEKGSYYRSERMSGRFYRRFTLPETADASKIQAKMSKGVLEVIIPKKEQTQPKAIEIQAEE